MTEFERTQLEEQLSEGELVEQMTDTKGWQIVEAHLKDQLMAYITDNATNASSWENYQEKAGKIFGIQILLTDIADFVENGKRAKEQLSQES